MHGIEKDCSNWKEQCNSLAGTSQKGTFISCQQYRLSRCLPGLIRFRHGSGLCFLCRFFIKHLASTFPTVVFSFRKNLAAQLPRRFTFFFITFIRALATFPKCKVRVFYLRQFLLCIRQSDVFFSASSTSLVLSCQSSCAVSELPWPLFSVEGECSSILTYVARALFYCRQEYTSVMPACFISVFSPSLL